MLFATLLGCSTATQHVVPQAPQISASALLHTLQKNQQNQQPAMLGRASYYVREALRTLEFDVMAQRPAWVQVEGPIQGMQPPPVVFVTNGKQFRFRDLNQLLEGKLDPCHLKSIHPGVATVLQTIPMPWVETFLSNAPLIPHVALVYAHPVPKKPGMVWLILQNDEGLEEHIYTSQPFGEITKAELYDTKTQKLLWRVEHKNATVWPGSLRPMPKQTLVYHAATKKTVALAWSSWKEIPAFTEEAFQEIAAGEIPVQLECKQ